MAFDQSSLPPVHQLFSDLIRSLVDDPQSVKIEAVASDDGLMTIRVRVPRKEMGRVIGINGRTARALRTLLTAVSTAEGGKRYMLDIQEQ